MQADSLNRRDDSNEIDQLVGELRQLHCRSGIELAVAIGRLVLERLYAGNGSLWRDRGRKDTSLRKLQRHPDLPFRAATLAKSVAIFLMTKRRSDILQLRRLGPSHLHEVLSLDSQEQDRIINAAEEHDWSVAQVRDEVRQVLLMVRDSAKSGRPRLPRFVSQLRRLGDELEQGILFADLEELASLSAGQTEVLLQVARQVCQRTELLTRRLSIHLSHLGAPTPRLEASTASSKLVVATLPRQLKHAD